MKEDLSVFWFRRDLRLEDNVALFHALNSNFPVLPIFIFDDVILSSLPKNDARVSFIYDLLESIHQKLQQSGSSLKIFRGKVESVWKEILENYSVKNVFFNRDYEPYAISRDQNISKLLESKSVQVFDFQDHVIFEKEDVLKKDGNPYTVYTPYKKQWLLHFQNLQKRFYPSENFLSKLLHFNEKFPSRETLNLEKSSILVKPIDLSAGTLQNYKEQREIPKLDKTSHLSPHLRFGSVSIRKVVEIAKAENEIFLSELIWREFFIQILYHFPQLVKQSFRPKYDKIQWRNDEKDFEKWKNGETGYPLIDAGMRELNTTGYMHNRVRMLVASFLTKNLLIDWRWGEAYFAEKLLDFELASNNGNWQWAAGTGCDAAPYFRIFNPITQQQKFDRKMEYIEKYIPEYSPLDYISPMVDWKFSRERALAAYKAVV